MPGPRLLLVDDEPDILETVSGLLEYVFPGIQITQATQGMQAKELLARQGFDLVITDYRMPGMDGAELAKHIGQAYPDLKAIMLTAYADAGTLADIRRAAPALLILTKPVELDEFLPAVRDALAPQGTKASANNDSTSQPSTK